MASDVLVMVDPVESTLTGPIRGWNAVLRWRCRWINFLDLYQDYHPYLSGLSFSSSVIDVVIIRTFHS